MRRCLVLALLLASFAAAADEPATHAALPLSTIPIPDPTLITTQQIDKAKIDLTTQFNDKITSLKELVAASIGSTGERAVALVGAKFDLLEEKINRLTSTEAADKGAQGEALVTALQAQEKLVADRNLADSAAAAKSEATFKAQIETLQGLITLQTRTLDDKLNLNNDRVTRLEGLINSAHDTRDQGRLDTGTILGAISLVVVLIVGFVTVAGFVQRRERGP